MKNTTMTRTILLLGAVVAALLGATALDQAQSGDLTFTFTSKSIEPAVKSIESSPYMCSYMAGISVVKYADG